MRAAVIVLGELGRSPRIRYHALALADAGVEVDVVGYEPEGAPDLSGHVRVRLHGIRGPRLASRHRLSRPAFVAYSAARVLAQWASLSRLLLYEVARPNLLLVQTPPAIPTLAVAVLSARVRSARLVVDWHNFGDSLLALQLGARHPMVRLAAAWERLLGRRAEANLCVSEGMRLRLRDGFGVAGAVVFRDRPRAAFASASESLGREVRARLLAEAGFAGECVPALAISPTSFTVDEDLDLLLDACDRLEAMAAEAWRGTGLPPLLVVVSGRGPLRERFEARAAARRASHVRVTTAWLPEPEYAALLKAADLGLSLHRSSSGLDLPMKIEDMFGAGLPVLALDFPSLGEQVRLGEDGLAFSSAAELAARLAECLVGLPGRNARLERLRAGARERRRPTWEEGWQRDAAPLLLGPGRLAD
jgi:beta-1,4-mannosyltransferase